MDYEAWLEEYSCDWVFTLLATNSEYKIKVNPRFPEESLV